MPEDTVPKSYDFFAGSAPSVHRPKIPLAPIRPTNFAFYGDDRIDKYHWLANNVSTDPAVMQYIDVSGGFLLFAHRSILIDATFIPMLRLNAGGKRLYDPDLERHVEHAD